MSEQAIDFERQRDYMVEQQLAARGIKDKAVLAAMGEVPREMFIPSLYLKRAYWDGPVPIFANQTISQPYVVAMMISLLQLQPVERVLEIGTGSGYAAAVLSRIVQQVYTVERHEKLVLFAQENLAACGYNNVLVHQGDGTLGWPEHAPYDAIIVAAAGPRVPEALQRQLAINGRLIMPVGKARRQRLILVRRQPSGDFSVKRLRSVRFVPLIGQQGWRRRR